MKHLEHDTLWSLSRAELGEAEAQAARAHLAQCPDCRVSFEDVQLAQQVLLGLPEVPPMPEQMVRRVGAQLAEAADARAARRFTSWWQSLFTPRFVLAAAVGVVLVAAGAWLVASTQPEPTPALVATPTPQPASQPLAPPPAPAAKKLSVTVASAKQATAHKLQVLAEGATISTHSGGSVWMKLPDGSRAGLTAASEVKLATLEEKQLTLELTRGSLAMVVPHRLDRVLTVRAGELAVKDLGTRFLVSRDANRTLVAVEEGKVEVTTPAGTREVHANHAVTWSNGQLTELAWEPTPPPAPQPVQVARPSEPSTPELDAQPDSIARLGDEDDDGDAPPPPEEGVEPQTPDQTPVAADEQWAQLPKNQPAPIQYAPAPPRERTFSLRNLERKLRELGTVITTPTQREAAVRNIALTADAGDCHHALRLADRWLVDPVTNSPKEPQLRRSVQLQQVRCLNHLGRKQDASAIQQMIDH